MGDRLDKFTERARRVLTLAQEEAQRFNHNYIGTEHLLLGLVREGDGIAARVLGNLGVQLPKVRSAVEFIIGRGETMIMGEIGLTPRAKKVIELAVDEARRLNHQYIGTEHLLLGLVREGEGIAAGVLESLGVSLEKLRAQVIQVLSQSGGARRELSSDQLPPDAPDELREAMRDLERSLEEFRTRERALRTRVGELMRDWLSKRREGDAPAPPIAPPAPRDPSGWRTGMGVRPPSSAPDPRLVEPLDDLLRVIPVAQRQVRGTTSLTFAAVELYGNGSVGTFRLITNAARQPTPDFAVTATDDRGERYSAIMHGGTGGGSAEHHEWRFACRFAPALDETARRLTVTLTPLLGGQDAANDWSFVVDLAGGMELSGQQQ
jgi:hypothetical protein